MPDSGTIDEARVGGHKRYFTGRPCKRGHVAERFARNGSCVVCNIFGAKLWREKNPERYGELIRLSTARLKERDPEGQYQKKWREENRERKNAMERLRYVKFPELIKANAKRWRERNPEKHTMLLRRRRALKAGATGSHTNDDLTEILKLQKNRCAHCRVRFGKIKPSLDHIIPLAKGGSDDRRNLQFLCKSCNSSKRAQDPLDFSRRAGMLL